MWIQMHSRWLWNVWYSNSSTLKIRDSFRLFLANQCNKTKSFNYSIDNNHPTIFFNQRCSWYKTHLLLAHLLNMCYRLSATILWRPHNLSPLSCWILQQLWLMFASGSPFSINSVWEFLTPLQDVWHSRLTVLMLFFLGCHSAKNFLNL